jgi:hypothetical protein
MTTEVHDRGMCKDFGLTHCPVHDPEKVLEPTLQVHERAGRTWVRCLADCPQEEVLVALDRLGLPVWP